MRRKASPPAPVRERRVSGWVKLFVAFHLAAITIWSVPNPPSAVLENRVPPTGSQWLLVWNHRHLKALPPVHTYLMTTGSWQYWDMFAPNPVRVDFWGDAEVRFRDGTQITYSYPRIARMSLGRKYVKERFRKFYERAREDQHSLLWPAFAQRIARLVANDPANPPVRVRLRRHWRDVGDPGTPMPKDYESYVYYEHVVDPHDLGTGGPKGGRR